ncbi:MAG: type II toxin-antitoxin system CcdA family antitoxin [Mariprofundus sp.]
MRQPFDTSAKKKAANLSLNSDLLAEAKRLQINLSATMEKALSEEVRQRKEKQWLEENQQAITSCNQLVEKNGLFSDAYRAF